MKTEESIVLELLDFENSHGFYLYKYKNFPIWRLYRSNSRNRVIKKNVPNFTNDSRSRKYGWIKDFVLNICFSLVSFIKLIFFKKNIDNVFFAFPRLQYFLGEYIDKFTDPVIDNSDLSQSVCVFQMPRRTQTVYKGNRWKSERVINLDFAVLVASMGALCYYPFHFFTKNAYSIYCLYKKAQTTFYLNAKDLIMWQYSFCYFLVMSYCCKFIYKRLKCKRIFIVNRVLFFPQILAAHNLNLPVYEFQHGVTHGGTSVYSGVYDPVADPDYFLVFGHLWIGKQFAMPLEHVVNIGWAYMNLVKSVPILNKYSSNDILVISSPEITNALIETIIDMAYKNPEYQFYIRSHPQEIIPNNLMIKIEKTSNVNIVDNSIDSFLALRAFQHILGVNSSVLYEGLSLGKNVGRIAYNGFLPSRIKKIENDGFFYFYRESDIVDFVKVDNTVSDNSAYSRFDSEVINTIL